MKQWKQFSDNLHATFPVQHQHQQLVTSALLQGSNDNNVWVPLPNVWPLPAAESERTADGHRRSTRLRQIKWKEQQLSSISRLIPDSYLEFRNILITECHNRKTIRLAQDRTLIKIDVNKPRKILNFLLEDKRIYFPSWFVAPTCCNHVFYRGRKWEGQKGDEQ